MGNQFLGFPVPRARIADMISGTAAPSAHHTQHENAGSDEIDVTGLVGAGGGGVGIFDFFTYSSTGEAITGYNESNIGSGVSGATYPGLYVESGTTAGSAGYISKGPGWPCKMLTFSKDRIFVANARLSSSTSVTCNLEIVSGDVSTQRHIGFQVLNGILKGTVGNGSAKTTVDLETLGAGAFALNRDLRAVFTSGVKCEFYVDGVLLGTITTGLPTGEDTTPTLFVMQAQNPGVAQQKAIYLTFYHVAIKF